MARAVSKENMQLERRISASLYDYLGEIKKEEDDDKNDFQKTDLVREKGKETEDELANKFLKALKNDDAFEVWELVENYHPIVSLEDLHQDCKHVVDLKRKEGRTCNLHPCSPKSSTARWEIGDHRKNVSADEQQREEDRQKNDAIKRKWIKILSNPLFISVEWLWKTKSSCQCEACQRSKDKDVIKGALDDAYFIEQIWSHEHYYDLDDYKSSVEAYETFAADVLEQSTLSELYEIIDIEGNGFLLQGKPQQLKKLDQSLRLLKITAKRNRKKFVASPRCQFILNEIIYYKWPDWQDKSVKRKLLWMIVQLLLATIIAPFYIPFGLFEKMYSIACPSLSSDFMWSSECSKKTIEWVRNLYEHPYAKFVNHIMSYFAFLCLLFVSSFAYTDDYKTSETGLVKIDYAVLLFVIGFCLREVLAAFKQGVQFYFSKWWNVMAMLTLCTLLASYTLWLVAWGIYGDWKPREKAFTVANVLYASAIVMAFLNFTCVIVINKTLGPLQLSLYRMLTDVLRFFVIFLVLYIAFSAGVVKVYSYYRASQTKLREDEGDIDYEGTHPYARLNMAAIGLFWLLLGNVEEENIVVKDPAFDLTEVFGRGFLIAYAVCTSIVALNMLIAMMNNSFDRIMKDADMEWKFSCTQMWLDYIDEGNSIPVPFNLVYYFLLIFSIPLYLFCGCCKRGKFTRCGTKATGTEMELVKIDVGKGSGNQVHIHVRESCTSINGHAAEGGKRDQTSANSCTCICSWCCCPSTCHHGPEIPDNIGKNSANCFACICTWCSCFCTTPKTDGVRKKRLQAMKFSVARYLNNRYVSGKIEGKTTTPTSLTSEQGTVYATSV